MRQIGPLLARRDLLAAMAAAGGAAALGGPGRAATRALADPTLAAHARDWEWLNGTWNVWHHRLRERLAGSNQWDDFAGKSAEWQTMGGFGTIDDNALELPAGLYRAVGIRAFDPATRSWSIWWLDGRNQARLDPPVRGRFDGDSGTFVGADSFNGRPIMVRFRWTGIHGPRPRWEQAFSADGGATWEVNWVNWFTRASAPAAPLAGPAGAETASDFAFLAGRWAVRNRRLRQRLVGSTDWEAFESRLESWPVLGGRGNVGDNLFVAPGGAWRGVSVRAFDPVTGFWSSWWLDSRNPTEIGAPLRGRFVDGVGTLTGDDLLDGRPIKTRSIWSRVTRSSVRWEQAASADGGASWETNWTADFTRIG